MQNRLWLRNALIIIGAYYLASLLLVPLWLPIAKLAEGHVYRGGWGLALMELFNAIPLVVGAGLAGLMAGRFLETSRPLGWAIGLGVFVALCTWSATQWHIRPSFSDLARQGVRGLVVGAVGFAACWMAERRRRSAPAGAPA